jgi:MFS family permease
VVQVTERETITAGHWRELWSTQYLRTSALVAGGVMLYATNEFLTISLLPSTIGEIGGERIYAWVTTLYLVGSVVAAATVNSVLGRLGSCSSYLLGLAVLGAGSLVCAVAPRMEILLIGRTLQGVAGGLLAGLSYAVINAVLPRSLWSRGSALASAMWGVGSLLGPALGGFFAQYGAWRWAFGVLGILSVAMAALVPGVLSVGRCGQDGGLAATKIPVRSVVLLGGAALAVSVACLPRNTVMTAVLLVAGAVLVGWFLVVDRRTPTPVLPSSVYGLGPLKWIYLTLGLLIAATKVDMYVPLFGQRLAHLPPMVAGFLGASLSLGWTISDLSSASLNNPRVIARVVATTPLVMAIGLALAAATHVQGAPVGVIGLCALALLITGIGIGAAWPHLSAWAMGRVDDPTEGSAAAAAINSVQLIFGAFGAGLAGVVVNITDGGAVAVARSAFTVFALLAATASVTAYRACRTQVLQ